MYNPKISVVMSVYNGSRYLDESIRSILGQTFPDLEFIIVDDSSIDETYDILEGYRKKDARVIVLKNETNIGLTKSLNNGIKKASGGYIARQDADDISMPDRLKKQLDFLERNEDYCCLGTFYSIIDRHGNIKYDVKLPTNPEDLNRALKTVNPLCHGSVMFRKQSAEKVGLYPEDYRYSQDYAFWHALARSFKLANLPEFLYRARIHKEAIGIRNKQEQWKSVFMIKKDLGLLKGCQKPLRHFIADEFFGNSRFFYKTGMKRLAINNFLNGLFYKFFASSAGLLKEKRPIGICMVTGAFHPEISGGGLQCRTLANSLKKGGFRFFILATTRSLLPDEVKSGVFIFRVNVGNMAFLDKIKIGIRIALIFLKLNNRIDVIHLHGFSNKTVLIILLAKMFRKRIVQKMTSLGDDDPTSLYKTRFGKLKRFVFSLPDLYISLTPAMSERFLASGLPKDRLLMVPNGVDTEKFCPCKDADEKNILREELNLPADATIMLFVGFFSRDKGIEVLFEAYKQLANEAGYENLVLLLIGSTDSRYFEIKADLVKNIRDEIKQRSLEKKVICIEKVFEIEKYYKVADIFILPSFREGLPNVLLEAMATGLPCISSDLEGVVDYVIKDGEEGLIFKKGDMEDLIKTTKKLLDNKDLAEKLGRQARSKSLDNFSISRIAKQYSEIYNHISLKQ